MILDTLLEAVVKPVIGKLFPDPEKQAELSLKLTEMQQAGEFKEIDTAAQNALAQIEVNKIEAASSDPYTSRARPTVVYVGAGALLYGYVVQPLLTWLLTMVWPSCPPPPLLDIAVLNELVFGILGIYTAGRTVEKVKKVA